MKYHVKAVLAPVALSATLLSAGCGGSSDDNNDSEMFAIVKMGSSTELFQTLRLVPFRISARLRSAVPEEAMVATLASLTLSSQLSTLGPHQLFLKEVRPTEMPVGN